MTRQLRYSDAVKLLGGQTPEMKVLDNLLGGVLAVATAGTSEVALSLFDAKAEFIRLGHVAAGTIHEKVRGLGRFDRTMRLQAAHGVLVVTSFFEAFDEIVKIVDLDDPELTRDNQLTISAGQTTDGDWLRRLLDIPLPVAAPDRTHADLLSDLQGWFAIAASNALNFFIGLRAWERAGEDAKYRAQQLISNHLTWASVRRFKENNLRLAAEIPEFALWIEGADRQARHAELRRSLDGLEAFLRRTSSGSDPELHRRELATAYRADLEMPVAEGDAGAVTFPTLAEAYIDPDFQVKAAGSVASPADEGWWDVDRRDDLATFLAAYLTTPQAAEAPLLLLGQPGAGKSSLTRVLAARLPAEDFLVVRVPLREVPADAGIHDQIEFAIRAEIHRTVSWADLSATANGAMPVILLDGFDELLQATGIHQSDYLKKVASFQRREAALGRPSVVMVTSRVAVADRATLPDGSLVVRLDGFGATQVERWLTTWNEVNAPHGRRPLTADALSGLPHLTEQPLLLLMLALYDAGDPLAPGELDLAGLYERLLRRFAEREVRRLYEGESEDAVPGLVEEELRRLSVMAFAMFNRGRQWVSDTELNDDLAALGVPPVPRRVAQAARKPLTAAEEVVGRFFFVQRAQAVQDGQTRKSYEFLHATFGEYLVARLVVHELRDDSLLRSLIGYEPLVARETVPTFLHALMPGPSRAWLMPALGQAMNRPSPAQLAYRPVDKRVDHWMAVYSFNLMVLTLACGAPVRASEVFPAEPDPSDCMRSAAAQWGAAMDGVVWGGFLDIVIVRRRLADGRRDIELEFGRIDSAENIDPWWTHGHHEQRLAAPTGSVVTGFTSPGHAIKSLHLGGGLGSDMLRHALDPLTSEAPSAFTTFMVHGDGTEISSALHDTLALWVASAHAAPSLGMAYQRAVSSARALDDGDANLLDVLILSLLARDAPALAPEQVIGWLQKIVFAVHYAPDLAPWVLDCLLAVNPLPNGQTELIRETVGMDRIAGDRWDSPTLARMRRALAQLSGHLSGSEIDWVLINLGPPAAEGAPPPG